jgi:hypothetical protein
MEAFPVEKDGTLMQTMQRFTSNNAPTKKKGHRKDAK